MSNVFRRSLIISKTSVVEVSILSLEDRIFTLSVKKDDHTWTLRKCYSEFVFFRKTILETASKFVNQFPVLSDENKEIVTEMNAWFKECGDAMNFSATLTNLYYGFLKVAENSIKPMEEHTKVDNSRSDGIFRREPLQSAVRTGYLLLCGNNSSNMENNLKRRYFALFDHLYYYENEAAYLGREDPEGIIKLDVYYITKSLGKNSAGSSTNINDFTIFSYNPMIVSYTCRASNSDELDAWFTTLNGFSSMI